LVTVERPELVVVVVLVLEIPNKSRRRTSTSTRRMLDFRLCGFGQHARDAPQKTHVKYAVRQN
jgi:hypothetical protein